MVSCGEGALTIGGKHISPDYMLDLSNPEYLSWEKYEESPEIKVFNGDVLLVKTASVGKVCFVEGLNEAATINPPTCCLQTVIQLPQPTSHRSIIIWLSLDGFIAVYKTTISVLISSNYLLMVFFSFNN